MRDVVRRVTGGPSSTVQMEWKLRYALDSPHLGFESFRAQRISVCLYGPQ